MEEHGEKRKCESNAYITQDKKTRIDDGKDDLLLSALPHELSSVTTSPLKMEEECNAEPEKEQPNLNTSVEEEEENYDEEEDYDEDEEADYEEDFSEEEDELEEGEVIVWSKEQEEVLKSALASFTLLPQTTVRKVVEELEVLGGCPDRLVARVRGWLGRMVEEGEDRMEVIRGRLEVADHAIGTPERASKRVKFQ